MLRFYFILVVLIASSFSEAETKAYGLIHLGITNSKALTDKTSYIGLKGVSQVTDDLSVTYKFELGLDITNHALHDQPYLNYSFVGLKSNLGELRLGGQDSAYDVVDNSMENFLTWQGNGLVTENYSSNLIAVIKKKGLFGFYGTHAPASLKNKKSSSSLMINYASGSLYLGLGLKKEQGSQKRKGIKLVITYKKDNYAIGFIHEKCPSSQNAAAKKPRKGKCEASGEGHINHISGVYSFGNAYVAAQVARNSQLGINKQTIELGTVLSQKTRAYIELDKVGTSKATTIGLKTRF